MSREEDVHQRVERLARKLLEQTRAGKLSWSDTDTEDQFLYSGSVSGVLIDKYSSRYELALLNARGTLVERIVANAPEVDGGVSAAEAALFDLFEDLYEAARREALNVDKIIDSLINDIDVGHKGSKSNAFDDDPPF